MTKIEIVKKEDGGMFLPQAVYQCEIAYPNLLHPSELTGKIGLVMTFRPDSKEAQLLKERVDALSMAYCGNRDAENPNPRLVLKSEGALKGLLTCSANRSPQKGPLMIVDKQKKPLSKDEIAEVGGTSLCNVAVTFFGYKYMGKKGISCALMGIQVLEARHPGASDMFGVVTEDETTDFMAML